MDNRALPQQMRKEAQARRDASPGVSFGTPSVPWLLDMAADEIERLSRKAEPFQPPDPAWWASDLPELRKRLTNLEHTLGHLVNLDRDGLLCSSTNELDHMHERLAALEGQPTPPDSAPQSTDFRLDHLERAVRALERAESEYQQEKIIVERHAAKMLSHGGYTKVPSVKRDQRYAPYWQRWQGPDGEMDWFEFPHDMPLDLVWDIIRSAKPA